MVKAVRPLQEKATILGASEGGVEKSPIKDELIDTEDGQGGFSFVGVGDVG